MLQWARGNAFQGKILLFVSLASRKEEPMLGKKQIFKFFSGGTHTWSGEDFEAAFTELTSSDDIIVLVDGLDEIFTSTEAEFEELDEYNRRAAVDQNLPTNSKQMVWAILNKVVLPKASVVATSRPHTGRVVAD